MSVRWAVALRFQTDKPISIKPTHTPVSPQAAEPRPCAFFAVVFKVASFAVPGPSNDTALSLSFHLHCLYITFSDCLLLPLR